MFTFHIIVKVRINRHTRAKSLYKLIYRGSILPRFLPFCVPAKFWDSLILPQMWLFLSRRPKNKLHPVKLLTNKYVCDKIWAKLNFWPWPPVARLLQMLQPNRRILDKFEGARFLFILQVIEKVQKKAQFSFCGQRKSLHHKIVLRGIQPYFLHGGKAATFWRILRRYIFDSMVKEITLLKGNLCIYKCFIDV